MGNDPIEKNDGKCGADQAKYQNISEAFDGIVVLVENARGVEIEKTKCSRQEGHAEAACGNLYGVVFGEFVLDGI